MRINIQEEQDIEINEDAKGVQVDLTKSELMKLLNLTHKPHFNEKYLRPSLERTRRNDYSR